jgi:hypothetical protein
MLLEVRVVDVDLHLPRIAVLGEVPVRQRSSVEIQRVPIGEILLGHPVVVLAHERLARHCVLGREALADASTNGVDQLRL